MKSFEHTGFWWDPRASETRSPGTLRFDPVKGAVLAGTMPLHPSRFFHDSKEFGPLSFTGSL